VRAEWGRTQGVAEVELVADGNGDFAEGMGLLVDRHEVGFGRRSRRYSMLVDDGVVRRAFVEPDAPGDPFEVSDADTMLASVAPDAARPPHVAMIAKAGCPHCARAADRLREARVPFVEIVLPDAVRGRALQALAGATTAPQVFVDGRLVGGSDALEEWLRRRPAPG
jgi:glutaredoxin-like protein